MSRHITAAEDKVQKSKGRVLLREASSGWRNAGKGLKVNRVSSSHLSRMKQVQWEDAQEELAKASLACMLNSDVFLF
jgi:hypothetical protein